MQFIKSVFQLRSDFIIALILVSILGINNAWAEKFNFDIYSPVACDNAFLGSEQVSAISPDISCKIKIRVSNKGKAVKNRRIIFSERVTSGQGSFSKKKTDSKGYVTFTFKVGEASCYFTAYSPKTGAAKYLVLLNNNYGACGV